MTSPSTADKGRPGDRVIEARFDAGAKARDQFPPPVTAELAFVGRSNVGKSSLLNCLAERRTLVRTSSTPGCTRQISWFTAICDDKATLSLVDLPGYGYAKRSKAERVLWGELIDGYLLGRPTLRAVVLLVDVRRGFEEDDIELLKMLESPANVSRKPLEIVLVATKLDKLSRNEHKPRLAQLTTQVGRPVLGFSAEQKLGRLPLWRKLRRLAGVGEQAATDGSTEAATENPAGSAAEDEAAVS
ncbi:MAG TPA: ribosome biogenesis GTP-binding protein YihA/YsxC [Polyangiaceae bacterium]|nr:ribosome biogenesis GTP-binding protein YihA/YsxC [Polyangiaceae bacterium]